MVRRRASLDADKTSRLLPEEWQNLPVPQLPADHSLTRDIDTVDLKNILRKIKPFVLTSAVGRLLCKWSSSVTTFWHLDAVWGHPPHYKRTL